MLAFPCHPCVIANKEPEEGLSSVTMPHKGLIGNIQQVDIHQCLWLHMLI